MDRLGDPPAARDLVERAQRGDRGAFDLLVEAHSHRLQCLIHLRMGPKLRQAVEPEDVEQETYLKAFRSIRQFQWTGTTSFFHWLGGIAEHVIQDLARRHLQAQKRQPGGQVSLDHVDHQGLRTKRPGRRRSDDATPSKSLQRNERFDRLESALSQLSEDHREVVLLAQVQSLPIKVIAERMGRSRDAVSMLLLRALRQLKLVFGDTESLHLPARSLGARGKGSGPAPEKPQEERP